MAMAMGAQNGVLGQVKGFRAGTTFVTGALFSVAQKIAQAITHTGPAFGWVGDGAVWAALLSAPSPARWPMTASTSMPWRFPAAIAGAARPRSPRSSPFATGR